MIRKYVDNSVENVHHADIKAYPFQLHIHMQILQTDPHTFP